MSGRLELKFIRDGKTHGAVSLGLRPVTVGRAPSNDLVLPDPDVSWHHLVVWAEGPRVRVQDLESSNGTFVNDRRVTSPTPVGVDDTVRLGPNVRLRLGISEGSAPTSLVLDEPALGVQRPLRSDRVTIGSGSDCDLVLATGPALAATLLLPSPEEVWLGVGEEDRLLAIGEPFEVSGRTFTLRQVEARYGPTTETTRSRYPFDLSVTLNGATGPEATVTNAETGAELKITASNRAVLLYLLARKWGQDEAERVPREERGWLNDKAVFVGVWGKSKPAFEVNTLNVLVHRVRKDLRDAGFDPWCVEKRRRYLRVRMRSVQLN